MAMQRGERPQKVPALSAQVARSKLNLDGRLMIQFPNISLNLAEFVSLSLYLSIYLFIYLSIYLSIYIYRHLRVGCRGSPQATRQPNVSHLRFGKALAKIRSKHRRQVRKAARQFLKEAVATENSLDTRVKINGHWLKHANLTPVLQFLSSVQ